MDASLFETQLSLLTNIGMSWLNQGIEAERWGCQHPSIVPYDAFQTKDLYLVCGATNDVQFGKLCKLLGLDSLISNEKFATNPKRVENREELGTLFNDIFKTKTTEEWIGIFEGTGLPFAPINNMERAFAHPQTAARNMVQRIPFDATDNGSIDLIGPAVKFGATAANIRTGPPLLGQHTEEVLNDVGVSEDEASQLRKSGVI